mmetsp:Transcript_41500/g.81354  ORF Transcript_41500/g.81354 Transcript_41500/m.81354 type:complete len:210 (+) Transcript_41500:337-966(+)
MPPTARPTTRDRGRRAAVRPLSRNVSHLTDRTDPRSRMPNIHMPCRTDPARANTSCHRPHPARHTRRTTNWMTSNLAKLPPRPYGFPSGRTSCPSWSMRMRRTRPSTMVLRPGVCDAPARDQKAAGQTSRRTPTTGLVRGPRRRKALRLRDLFFCPWGATCPGPRLQAAAMIRTGASSRGSLRWAAGAFLPSAPPGHCLESSRTPRWTD